MKRSQTSTAADRQVLAGRDQTLADAEQTASDSDQTAADNDQSASDTDQAASDRDLIAHGDNPDVHSATRDLRDHSAQKRRQGAQRRVSAATDRDGTAHARDLAATTRDQAAELLDSELAKRDAAPRDGRSMTGAELVERAPEDRKRAASDRDAAAESRARAASDRTYAAHDRERAARDRLQSRADRDALLTQLAISETDQLTGARTRAAGLADVDREIDRARRATGLLVIAYVDVVGLKAVNDARGHAAGDALLQHAVRGIRSHLRTYDLIVRVGGDEFVCAMPGATIDYARQRFTAIQAELAADGEPCAIKVGFTELAPGDSTAELIARADDELPTSPGR